MLGENPVRYLLSQHGAPSSLTQANRNLLTGREFFPEPHLRPVPRRPGPRLRRLCGPRRDRRDRLGTRASRPNRAHAGTVTRTPRLRLPALRPRPGPRPVSYTHLTLPTIYSV